MFHWSKNKRKDYPQFWKDYEEKFEEHPPQFAYETTFTVLDTETTGFDYKKDRILCIGALKIENFIIDVSKNFEVYIEQEKFNPDTVEIHGIRKNEPTAKLSEEKALEDFLRYIGNSVLVAHHAGFDIGMIDNALKRMGLPKLKNKVLDTGILYRRTLIISNFIDREKKYSLDKIAETYSIETKDRHTAAGDAFITAIAFLKIMGRLKKKSELTLKELFHK